MSLRVHKKELDELFRLGTTLREKLAEMRTILTRLEELTLYTEKIRRDLIMKQGQQDNEPGESSH